MQFNRRIANEVTSGTNYPFNRSEDLTVRAKLRHAQNCSKCLKVFSEKEAFKALVDQTTNTLDNFNLFLHRKIIALGLQYQHCVLGILIIIYVG